jgi:hypothetical protein
MFTKKKVRIISSPSSLYNFQVQYNTNVNGKPTSVCDPYRPYKRECVYGSILLLSSKYYYDRAGRRAIFTSEGF